MTVEGDHDLRGLLRIGQICGETLKYMLERVQPGMSTAELDQLGAEFLAKQGAKSAPITAYRFPGHTCISINDEVAHGIPGNRVIQPGDMVNIDVSAVLEGYWCDTGASVPMPPVNPEYDRLCDYTRQALQAGIAAAQEGAPLYAVGRAIESVAQRGGYNIIRDLGGHGVGRHIHEKPSVPNYYTKRAKSKLTDGLVVTIEPFLTPGRGTIYTAADKWTLKTNDGRVAAQYEHTIIINGNAPILLTAV